MKPRVARFVLELLRSFLLLALSVFLSQSESAAQGYELDSLSVESPPATLFRGDYSMQADLVSQDDLSAAGDGYLIAVQTADLVVIESVEFPVLTLSWDPVSVSGLRVTWLDPTERFTLESASSLGSAAEWRAVGDVTHEGATAVFEGNGLIPEDRRFFRLVAK